MKVRFREEAVAELAALPAREADAMRNAVRKLAVAGDFLRFPHQSAVKATSVPLRELRPRAGDSPWRAFYRRIGDELVIGAIGPEARVNPRGFERAVAAAVARLADEGTPQNG